MKTNNLQLIKNSGLKTTLARVKILEVLQQVSQPVDVLEVREFLQKRNLQVNLTTIYRCLESFLKAGIVTRVEFQEGKYRYELSQLKHHHHLVCKNCGKVEDVDDCSVEDLEKNLMKKSGFLIKTHSLEFYGRCKNCH